MPIQDTYQEYLAKKINSRNYADILPVISFLKRRENEEYATTAFTASRFRIEHVGENQATSEASFYGTRDPNNPDNAKTSFLRGQEILLRGKAVYRHVSATTVLAIKPAVLIVAQINMEQSQELRRQVYMASNEIDASGFFSFKIPSDMTQGLPVGRHSVYLDAQDPVNAAIRLNITGTENNITYFNITG